MRYKKVGMLGFAVLNPNYGFVSADFADSPGLRKD